MNTINFLSYLRSLDVKITVNEDRILCNAPTGVLTRELQSKLSKHKNSIIKLYNTQLDSSDFECIKKIDRTQELPLSFAQERFWFLDKFNPEYSFNEIQSYRLKGALNVAALKYSLKKIVQRHEILRTNYKEINGRAIQVINDDYSFDLMTEDLTRIPKEKRESEVKRLALEAARHVFDLSNHLLIRANLWKLADNKNILLITQHHIVCDDWSDGIFRKELSAFYQAFINNEVPLLPNLPIQYADYANWSRQWYTKERLQPLLDYWKNQLKGELPVSQLPLDKPRPKIHQYNGAKETIVFSKELTDKLKALSIKEEVTLCMLLMSAFKTLVYRYSQDKDIIIGFLAGGRGRLEIENLLGFFVNTIPIRTNFSGNPTFRELLNRIKKVLLEVVSYQDLPMQKMVETIQPARNQNYTPFFQLMFIFQNSPKYEFFIPGVTVEDNEVYIAAAKLDLILFMEEEHGCLRGDFEYNADLFEPETIRQFIDYFQILLEGIVEKPDSCLLDFPLIRKEKHQEQLASTPATQKENYSNQCVHQLFQRQAEQTPNAIAVFDGNKHISFIDLNNKANQLANFLIYKGAKPETRIGICLDRSIDLLIAYLGVLKAGAAYVPLDPKFPKERLNFMSKDSDLELIVSQEIFKQKISSCETKIIDMNNDWILIEKFPTSCPQNKIDQSNIAYILYTSGSTGKPKGVFGLHKGIINRIFWQLETFPYEKGEVCCQKTSINFVDSVCETFSPLINGIPLVIIPDSLLIDPRELVNALANQKVSRITLIPSLLNLLLNTFPDLNDHLPLLKYWITSGETLSKEVLQKFYHIMPDKILLNIYGSTEVSADALWHDTRTNKSSPRSIIGKPLGYNQIYILDAKFQPVPPGIPGEIYISGTGVSRGYTNSEQTALKFIPNPFSGNIGDRLYVTGDLGRYLPDGNVEFLGRMDHQIKIRGFRIETDEIESVLAIHESVQQNVVTVRNFQNNEHRLVSYSVLKPGKNATSSALREFLKKSLPEYMLPSICVILPEMPLLPNGKINRNELPDPDRNALEKEFVAPATSNEEILCRIWMDILEIDRIGTLDNFFELGGHSLLISRIISRIRDVFHIEISMNAFFNAPNIQELAKLIDIEIENDRFSYPKITPAPRKEYFPLSFAQQQMWLMTQMEGNDQTPSMSYAIEFHGMFDKKAFENSLNEVIKRHGVLRTRFTIIDESPVQVIDKEGKVRFKEIDLTHISQNNRSHKVKQIIYQESIKPFDLNQSPLIRGNVIKLTPELYVLFINMHHLVSDGWSTSIFIHELSEIYKAITSNQPIPLAPLFIQYSDFAYWQRKWLTTETMQAHHHFWKKQLTGIHSSLELPIDKKRPLVSNSQGKRYKFNISSELTNAIKTFSNQHGNTVFITLLSVFNLLLYLYSGQKDFIVGSPNSNRNRSEIENLIGLFAGNMFLRFKFKGNPSFQEIVSKTRQVFLDTYAHQDIPLDEFAKELNLHRDKKTINLIQAWFSYQTFPAKYHSFLGQPLKRLEIDNGVVPVELGITVWDGAEGYKGVVSYRVDLFEENTIRQIVKDFLNLIQLSLAQPQYSMDQFLLTSLDSSPLIRFYPEKEKFIDLKNISNLSLNQLLIWFNSKIRLNFSTNANIFTFIIRSPIDIEKFKQAFEIVLNIHERFRISIDQINGIPQKKTHSGSSYQLEFFDYSNKISEYEKIKDLIIKQFEEKSKTDHLLFEAALIKLLDHNYIFYTYMHPIIADENENLVFFQKIAHQYDSLVMGVQEEKKFFQQQVIQNDHKHLRDHDEFSNLEDYWKKEFKNELNLIYFFGAPLMGTPGLYYQKVSYQLNQAKTKKLQSLIQNETVFQQQICDPIKLFFLALTSIYLFRVGGNKEFYLGTSYQSLNEHGHTHISNDLEDIFPLSIEIKKEDTIISLISRIIKDISNAKPYGQYFIKKIHRQSAYNILLQYQKTTSDLTINQEKVIYDQIRSANQYDEIITLLVENHRPSNSINLNFIFRNEFFDNGISNLIMQQFSKLIIEFLSDFHQPIDPSQWLLYKASNAKNKQTQKKDLQGTNTLHSLFLEQVKKTPNEIAVSDNQQNLSYEELNKKSNQLANYLLSKGVGQEMFIGVCLERSVEMVIALLGILKAGCAYVPLDPSYPKERLAFMVSDSQTPLILTQTSLNDVISNSWAEKIYMDSDWNEIKHASHKIPSNKTFEENLAYMIFTSGSTGRPKGVMNTHAGICNRLQWMQDVYCINPSDKVLQKTPFSFDVSVWEFFWPLLNGATLFMAKPEGHKDSAYLKQLIVQENITIIHFVPSMLRLFLDEKGIENLKSLRLVICSGEALPYELQTRFFGFFNCDFHNLYGPTEAAVDVTYWKCEKESQYQKSMIGRPISNIQLFILNKNLKPVPIGVAGELYIGGIGLARGYSNRPELTAESFIPNPFGKIPGERLYKTGDLVRLLPNKNIEFIGRMDNQIKIRGFRVELAEIEHILKSHHLVKDAVVIAHNHQSQDFSLISYLVLNHPEANEDIIKLEIQNAVKSKLPDHMIPSAFLILENMPLTPNGKLDRKSLPDPKAQKTVSDTAYIAPRNHLEMEVTRIWEDLLNTKSLSVTRDLFDAGAHSLLAVRFSMIIEKQFDQKLQPILLFQNPSIEQLARIIKESSNGNATSFDSPLVPIQNKGTKIPFFCIHPIGGDVFCYINLARHLGDNQPFYGLQSIRQQTKLRSFIPIEEMATCYLKEIRKIQPKGPYQIGGWSLGGVIAYEMAFQLSQENEETRFLGMIDSYAPLYDDFDKTQNKNPDSTIALHSFAKDLGLSIEISDIMTLDLDDQLQYIINRAKRDNLMPQEVRIQEIKVMLSIYQSNLQAIRNYQVNEYSGSITLFSAFEESCTKTHDLTRGWNKFTTTDLKVEKVLSSHFEILREPAVLTLAEKMKQYL